VLVDISVDQGGCFEDTHATTHSDPVYPVHNSLFYCVANMPGAVPHVDPRPGQRHVALHARHRGGWLRQAVDDDPALAEGVNVVGGAITCEPVAEAHGLDYTPLSSLPT